MTRMHADEVTIELDLVRQLISEQFPEWAGLPIRRVASNGTDNAMFRLGQGMVVRMPRIHWAVDGIAREQQWLPYFAGRLPVLIPKVLGKGLPGGGYPWHWTILDWQEGENPAAGRIADPEGLARSLADFINGFRSLPVAAGVVERRRLPLFDTQLRKDIAALEGSVDTAVVTEIWETALKLPAWTAPPVWLHGDLAPGNLLLTDNRLSGVIDFSGIGIGDPCDDLQVAWNLLPASARPVLREAVRADEATWLRARARALAQALVQLPYYRDTNPPLAENARHVIGEITAEHRSGI